MAKIGRPNKTDKEVAAVRYWYSIAAALGGTKTPYHFASEFGLDKNQIVYDWATGRRRPTKKAAEKIDTYLFENCGELSIRWLLRKVEGHNYGTELTQVFAWSPSLLLPSEPPSYANKSEEEINNWELKRAQWLRIWAGIGETQTDCVLEAVEQMWGSAEKHTEAIEAKLSAPWPPLVTIPKVRADDLPPFARAGGRPFLELNPHTPGLRGQLRQWEQWCSSRESISATGKIWSIRMTEAGLLTLPDPFIYKTKDERAQDEYVKSLVSNTIRPAQ